MDIEPDNLEVEVSRCLCNQLEVRILGSPFDRPREQFDPPYDLDALTAQLKNLDDLLLDASTSAGSAQRKIATKIGVELFKALLPGQVGKTFARCVSSVETARESNEASLRIRISFGEADRYLPEIVGLPWELLCDPESLQFPGSEPQSPIVRYLDISKRIRPLKTTPPLKVLAILSSPKATAKLRLSPIDLLKHKAILRRAQKKQKWLKVVPLEHASITEVRGTLERHRAQGKPFHALHFLGHGEFHDGEGVLYFEKPGHRPHPVTGRALAKQLAGFDELRLAVLATCVGAQMMRQKGQHPFTGAASALIARGLPAVVAMQFSISEEAATQFTSTFYDKIAAGRPVDEAVTEGRLKMAAYDVDSFEWACPVLFLRTPNGKILDIQPADEVPVKKIAVFNVLDHAKDDVEVNDYEVDLTDFFELREDRPGIERAHIKDSALWNTEVMGALTSVFNRDLLQDAHYRLVIAAPISVAFAAGYLMHTRTAHGLVFPQRGHHGVADWTFEGEISAQAARWMPEGQTEAEIPPDLPMDETSSDVAVIVEPSRPVLPAVRRYLRESGDTPRFGHVFYAKLDQGSGQSTVENGAHAFRLAEELCNLVHAHTSGNPRGTVHWFISGPNTLVFALGRLSRCFQAMQLYEFDLGGQGSGSGTYEPSITLPQASI